MLRVHREDVQIGRKIRIANTGEHLDLVNARREASRLIDEHGSVLEHPPQRPGLLTQPGERIDLVPDRKTIPLIAEEFAIHGDVEAVEEAPSRAVIVGNPKANGKTPSGTFRSKIAEARAPDQLRTSCARSP